ncbi:putative disease resistance protein RGA3 [Rosa chinensis]|uniref:putative disease resistance protein RGA3 n=1 Tax=Rosa chinensis TaxID=74649 RepID=UPI000D086F6F|nr:putative disease resistance protein RGA3 [Rosa chinensis]
MGGLGKTTFTQLVFKDAQVQAHFDIKAWVCVSDPFDIEIAKEILELVSGIKSQDSSNVLQKLLESIQERINGNNFLLVLDDVWTKDQTKWESLRLPVLMQTCSEGSRILVTTQKQEVARMMRATRDMITLEKLSHLDSLELFYNVAFLDREQDKSNKGFGDIAEKIVRKCDGLSLVLKTLGGLSLHKQTIREWEEV